MTFKSCEVAVESGIPTLGDFIRKQRNWCKEDSEKKKYIQQIFVSTWFGPAKETIYRVFMIRGTDGSASEV